VHDATEWWLQVLERHYARGGPPAELATGIPA